MSEVILKTEDLTALADRLKAAAKSCGALSEQLSKLIWQVPACLPYALDMANSQSHLTKCEDFLRETARVYADTEPLLERALVTGIYEGSVIREEKTFWQEAGDVINSWIEDHKDALQELYDEFRNGDLEAGEFMLWLAENVLINEDVDWLNDIRGALEEIYEAADGVFEILSAISDIGEASGLNGIPFIGTISGILSVVDSYTIPFDLAAGAGAYIWGFLTGDETMINSGVNYLDDALNDIGDIVMLAAQVTGPYAILISLGVDYKINQWTNTLESVARKDDPLEFFLNTQIYPVAETLNDFILGNFICQSYVQNKAERKFKKGVDFVTEAVEWCTGVDLMPYLREDAVFETLYDTDNWLKSLHKYIDDKIG